MEETIAALEAEITRMQQTIAVVRTLKPIQRQQDQCMTLIREHVAALAAVVEPEPTATAGSGSALPPGHEEGQAAA